MAISKGISMNLCVLECLLCKWKIALWMLIVVEKGNGIARVFFSVFTDPFPPPRILLDLVEQLCITPLGRKLVLFRHTSGFNIINGKPWLSLPYYDLQMPPTSLSRDVPSRSSLMHWRFGEMQNYSLYKKAESKRLLSKRAIGAHWV